MKKYFKGRFFYIITTLALIFTIVPTVLSSMGLGFIFRDMVGVVLTPAQKLFNYATEGIDGFVSYFYKFDELVEENTRLREEVSSLQTKIYDSAEVEEMYNDFQFLAATVTGRESGNYSKILTLDVGSGAGVSVGMPIITAEGIVGQVTEVGYNWSKVTTIIEANSSVGAYIEKTKDAGICSGSFALSANGMLEMLYLPADAKVEVGDRVLSTGYGSIYPRGLVVGYIEEVALNDYSRSLDVKVKTAVNLSEITNVMVITKFEQVSE